MKKILFRKFLTDFLKFFLISLLSAATIIWVFQAVNFLDIIVEDGRDYNVYIYYSLLTFPKVIGKILPFVLFFSFYYVIITYEENNELIIYWNFGINKINLINFFLFCSLFIVVFQIILVSLIVPRAQDLARSLIRSSNIGIFEDLIKEKKFNDIIKDITIHAEKKYKNGNLENIFIKKNLDGDNFEITYAKKGKFNVINENQFLNLYEGENISGNKNNITSFSFSESIINLSDFESNAMKTIKTQENSTEDLIECYLNLKNKNIIKIDKSNISKVQNCNIDNLSEIIKEIYKRLIIPLYIPLLMLVSLLLINFSKENLKYKKNKIIVFFIGLLLIIISESSMSFVRETITKNIGLIVLPIISSIIIYLYFFYKFKINPKI